MKKQTIIFSAVLGLVSILLLMLLLPVREVRTYRAVDSLEEGNWISDTNPRVDAFEQYALYDNKLYLLVQVKKMSLLAVLGIEHPSWTQIMIEEFRKHHSELESYWPEATQTSGGVQWINSDNSD